MCVTLSPYPHTEFTWCRNKWYGGGMAEIETPFTLLQDTVQLHNGALNLPLTHTLYLCCRPRGGTTMANYFRLCTFYTEHWVNLQGTTFPPWTGCVRGASFSVSEWWRRWSTINKGVKSKHQVHIFCLCPALFKKSHIKCFPKLSPTPKTWHTEEENYGFEIMRWLH